MDILKIQNTAIARSQGQDTDPQLGTTAMMVICSLEEIVCIHENVYQMDIGLDVHHNAVSQKSRNFYEHITK